MHERAIEHPCLVRGFAKKNLYIYIYIVHNKVMQGWTQDFRKEENTKRKGINNERKRNQ